MISAAICDKNAVETKQLYTLLKDAAAYLSEDAWDIRNLLTEEQIMQFFSNTTLLDMLLYEVTSQKEVQKLADIRKDYEQSGLLLLADMTVSPMMYMRPGIRADSLLLRPWSKEQAVQVIRDFVDGYLRKNTEHKDTKDSDVLIVENREDRVRIPFSKIYFIEARRKKVFVCAGREEYGYYDTIEQLQEKLPPQFKRCHRSFIVNTDKISDVKISQSLIFLNNGMDLPLSRSYKPDFKQKDAWQ